MRIRGDNTLGMSHVVNLLVVVCQEDVHMGDILDHGCREDDAHRDHCCS